MKPSYSCLPWEPTVPSCLGVLLTTHILEGVNLHVFHGLLGSKGRVSAMNPIQPGSEIAPSTSFGISADNSLGGLCITKHFRYLKWRNPHLYKLYVRENPSSEWPYKVQYLHFRYLKLMVTLNTQTKKNSTVPFLSQQKRQTINFLKSFRGGD